MPAFTSKLKLVLGILYPDFFKESICSWFLVVYCVPEKNLIFMNFCEMLSLLNWLFSVILNIVWCSIHSFVSLEINNFFSYRKDVVSLPDGLFANVLLIWKEVCWPNHTDNIIFEKRALYCTISWYWLGSSSQFVCKG